jgi:hypothetical protein
LTAQGGDDATRAAIATIAAGAPAAPYDVLMGRQYPPAGLVFRG